MAVAAAAVAAVGRLCTDKQAGGRSTNHHLGEPQSSEWGLSGLWRERGVSALSGWWGSRGFCHGCNPGDLVPESRTHSLGSLWTLWSGGRTWGLKCCICCLIGHCMVSEAQIWTHRRGVVGRCQAGSDVASPAEEWTSGGSTEARLRPVLL